MNKRDDFNNILSQLLFNCSYESLYIVGRQKVDALYAILIDIIQYKVDINLENHEADFHNIRDEHS